MLPFTIYGGDGSDLGHVRQLQPTSFEQFVKETLGHAVVLNVTREQFHALPKDKRDAIKRVSYVTPATFKQSPSRRLYEEASTFQLVALDIDDSDQARPFFNDPQSIADSLSGLNFAAYTTATHTTEKPRLRVFVHTESLPLKSYNAAVSTVAQRLGLPSVTKESTVVVQPMYLPTIFRGSDAVMEHPVIASEYAESPLRASDLTTKETPSGTTPKKSQSFNVDGDDLDFLRPTVEAITIEDAKEALSHLDADMVYNEWLEVAAALRHQFPFEPEASQAYQLFDEWSATGDKYPDADATLEKWNSLKPNPKGRAPVTIRSLLHKAQEAGWECQKLTSKCYAKTVEWMADPTRTGNELMAEGVKRIAATPLLTPLERGSLLSLLQDVLKRHAVKVQRTELKKELSRLERQGSKATETKVTPDSQLPQWARGICYVAQANMFYHRASNRALKPEAFDKSYNAYLTEPDAANGKPPMTACDYILNIAKVPRVDNFRYDPAHPEQVFINEGKQRFVNTYIPTHQEPDATTEEKCGQLLMAHIKNLIAEPEYQTLFLDWMAFQIQNPGIKIRWAVILQGAEGCGKTFIADLMKAVMGKEHVNALEASILTRDMFNGWAYGCQLVAVEEIRVVGHNRHEVMNRLKPHITNDTISVRDLNKPLIQVPNNVNYIMFTNFQDSLAIGKNDRRYFVINSRLQNKAQVVALGADYFKILFDTLKESPGGFRAFLENWRISDDFRPNGHAPATKYLYELMESAASPLNAAISEAIADADHPLIKPDLVSTKALKDVVDLSLGKNYFTDQQIASALREMDFVKLGRIRVEDDRVYIWAKRGSGTCEMNQNLLRFTAQKRLEEGPVLAADGTTVDFSILE